MNSHESSWIAMNCHESSWFNYNTATLQHYNTTILQQYKTKTLQHFTTTILQDTKTTRLYTLNFPILRNYHGLGSKSTKGGGGPVKKTPCRYYILYTITVMNRYKPSLTSHVQSWTVMSCHDLSWIVMNFMNFHELSWTVQKRNEMSWIGLNCHELSWIIKNLHEGHELSWIIMYRH